MSNSVNLTSIYIANLMAVVLLIMTVAGNRRTVVNNRIEKLCIMLMICTAFLACALDTLAFTFDGRPGFVGWFFAFVGNSLLFCLNMVIGPAWSALVTHHVRGSYHKYEKYMVCGFSAIGFVLIIINIFRPIVFYVDENNVYHRNSFYAYFVAMEIFFMIYGLVTYCIARSRGGVLKFFPVLNFIIPIIIGITLQTLFYGVSTIPPFVTVSVCCMINSLQNERIYRDTLTGLYNRAYFDFLKKECDKKRVGSITAIMIDLNDFKSINDNYGHSVGDDALLEMSGILRRSIGILGSVIRYAGDEFVILLNTHDDQTVQKYIDIIAKNIDNFNREAGKQYGLSYAIGYYSIDLKKDSVDKLFKEVDQRMYQDKEAYYINNPDKNRRKTSR